MVCTVMRFISTNVCSNRNASAANEVLSQARDFLIQSSGVKEVYTAHQLLFDNRLLQKVRNGFNHNVSGDLLIQVAPGWKIYNEETREELFPSVSYLPFPIILYRLASNLYSSKRRSQPTGLHLPYAPSASELRTLVLYLLCPKRHRTGRNIKARDEKSHDLFVILQPTLLQHKKTHNK